MRYRILDAQSDMTFGSGQQNFYNNTVAGVAQAVQTTLLLWLGEYFLNTDAGTPYLQGILGKHSQALADATIQDVILGVTVIDQGQSIQAVTSIDNFSSTLDPITRKYTSLTMKLNTIYGATPLEIANYELY